MFSTIDAISPWTAGHSERVTRHALEVGRLLGLDAAHLDRLRRGGPLHDIGKVAVQVAILDKPGRLTKREREIVVVHPTIGFELLASDPAHADVLAVADVYDALTSDRTYRAGMAHEQAVELMLAGTCARLDAAVVGAFLALRPLRRRRTGAAHTSTRHRRVREWGSRAAGAMTGLTARAYRPA